MPWSHVKDPYEEKIAGVPLIDLDVLREIFLVSQDLQDCSKQELALFDVLQKKMGSASWF